MSLKWRLFTTYIVVIIVTLVVVALGVSLLMRGYVDRLSLARLDDMTRPIYVQIVGMIRGNVTPAQLLATLQEQADKNGAYILLVDGAGNIERQLIPLKSDALPITVTPGSLPLGLTSPQQGKITATDGRLFLYSAYPLIKQSGQLDRVETMFLATIRPGTFSVLKIFMPPLLIAAGLALIFALLIAVLLARSVYRPLTKFTTAARQISKGDYSQRIKIDSPQEISEMADSFNRMTHDVEQSQLRLRHFVADVSHELRSPLTSIQGFAQALIDGTASDDATKLRAAQIIDEEARRLKRQVDELLELSRMQSNQIQIGNEKVDLKEVLRHSVEIYEVQAKKNSIDIDLKLSADTTVTGDADRLEQVFNNLIDNAIKNSPTGGKISVILSRPDEKLAQIVVADEGPGIPADQIPYVFERFYQVTGSRTGVGLGLAIAREIIMAHYGSIEISSQPGQGARFTVKLPLN